MAEVVSALGGREAGEARAEQRPERVDGPTAGCTEDGFQLGEAELDGVEVGAVGRQEPQGCAGGFDRVAHPVDFVRGKVVRNDDIAGLEGGDEDLLDVGTTKSHTIDGSWMRGKLYLVEKIGSSGRTRTYNPPVNSRMLCQLSY